MSFSDKIDYVPPAGSALTSIAVSYFDSDNFQDLAVVDAGNNNVMILSGNGDGTFHTTGTFPVENNPKFVATGDFNADGRTDLVAVNFDSNSISVLLGNGDGTFQVARNILVENNPYGAAVGDFNGDGNVDVAVANSGSNTITLLLGDGGGNFPATNTINLPSSPYSLAAGDYNGDGHLDLAVTYIDSSKISILLGNGDGTFQPAVDYDVGSGSWSIATGDLNGDGILDLAVANGATANVSILLGNGDGTFQTKVNYPVENTPSSVQIGDFDGDGHADLFMANFIGNNVNYVSILRGNGDGTFQAAENFSAGSNPYFGAVGDFNNDGNLDLAVASDNVSILLNNLVSAMVSPSPLNFGTVAVNSSVSQVVTIRNTSVTTTLGISSITVTGGESTLFSIDTGDGSAATCGSSAPTLAVGGACTITVTFSPISAGTATTTLRVASDTPTSPTKDVVLTGSGVTSSYTVTTVPDANGSVVCTSPVITGGSSVCTITPAGGYRLTTLTDNGVDKSGAVAGNSYTISGVTANHAITATFNLSPSTLVNGVCGTSNGGTFIVAPTTNFCTSGAAGSVTGSGPWNWSCSGSSGGTSASCSANIQTYTITAIVTGGNGTVSCDSPVDSGANSNCSVTPIAGYRLITFTDNGSSKLSAVSGTSYIISTILVNHTITATFSPVGLQDGIINPDPNKTAPDISDALAALHYSVGLTSFTASQLQHADVAPLGLDGKPLGNMVVDIADVIIILRRSLGIGNW